MKQITEEVSNYKLILTGIAIVIIVGLIVYWINVHPYLLYR